MIDQLEVAMADRPKTNVGAYCDVHGKAIFYDKGAAKRHLRLYVRKGMRPYRCDVHPTWWHVGHLPLIVVAGLKTVAEVYRPRSEVREC